MVTSSDTGVIAVDYEKFGEMKSREKKINGMF
jgi:hypothetical protein